MFLFRHETHTRSAHQLTFDTQVDFLSEFGESKQTLSMERQKEARTAQPNAYWVHTITHNTAPSLNVNRIAPQALF